MAKDQGNGKPDFRRTVTVCLGLVLVLAAACGGGDASQPTETAPVIQTRPAALPTAIVPGYTISGVVLDSSNNWLLGGQITLEPSGKSAETSVIDGSYRIDGVPDGIYEVSITPKCVAYGCYGSPVLIVAGSDITEFDLAPVPASALPGGPAAARPVLGGSMTLEEVEFPSDNLVLISPNDMRPGQSVQIVVAAPECYRCPVLAAVDAVTRWSVTPAEGVSIEPESGLLSIGAAVPAGTKFTVTADVGEGRNSVSAEVNVYSADENPLAGVWHEPETGNINRLLLTADGEFAVTLNPFGSYQDYWGVYTFDLSTGAIELTATGANQVAPEANGRGAFSIGADGVLSLEGVCFGRWDDRAKSPAPNCGHRFEK